MAGFGNTPKTETIDVICNRCKNHIKGLKCKAFEVIPDSIIFGENDHSEPLPDQGNEIVFEPIDKE